ncbi:MAG TPA: hypothetical protein VMV69_24610 [Pirellulales bacterium]|nr:hypothetical protein [Pirellulales bacterium]
MIAPWRKPSDDGDTLAERCQLVIARRMIAAALLPEGEARPRPPRAAAWRAWLWVAWMLLTVGFWILSG